MIYTETLQQAEWPTEILVLDFETYFDTEYSLSKMSIVEYVSDSRFEFTGLGIEILNHPKADGSFFIPGPNVEWAIERLKKLFGKALHNCTLVAKNCKFDMLILAEKFGIYPAFPLDIEDLSRTYDSRMSQKLKDLTTYFKLAKPKGDTKQFKGLHYAEMSEEQRENLAEYGRTDIELETALLKILLPYVSNPKFELALARHSLNLYLHPVFNIDYILAEQTIQDMDAELRSALDLVGHTEEEISGTLSFTEILLKSLSRLPGGQKNLPTKPGKPTKNMVKLLGQSGTIPALAKTNEGFKQLLNHKDENIRNLMKAKIAIKSWPNWIKRVKSFVNQCKASGDKLRIPLKYYGGHTGRWSGTEKINVQNLGGRGRGVANHPLIGQVRNLLTAPDGYKLTIVDSAQIEARLLAWLAGQDDLTKGFANGEDIYSVFATTLFGEKVWKPTDEEKKTKAGKTANIRRGFGKDAILGCIAVGSLVLTNTGLKAIEDITVDDELWDGVQWVNHAGIVYRGAKECIQIKDVWMTPEHEILTSEGWTTAAELNINNQQLEVDMVNLPCVILNMGQQAGSSPSNVVAPVVEFLLRQEIIWSLENLHAVMSVLKRHPVKLRAIAHLLKNHIKADCLIEFVQLLADVKQDHIKIMVSEVLESGPVGSQIELLFLNIWQHCQDGIIRNLKSTGLITIGDMNLVILDSLPGSKILETVDILYSGYYKRFQVEGLICSNCGYGMGTNTFFTRCRENDSLRPLFDSGEYDWDFINRLIKTYRKTYNKIPELWTNIEKAFRFVCRYSSETAYHISPYDKRKCTDTVTYLLKFWKSGNTVNVQLPSGRVLYYHHAKVNRRGDISYDHGKLWGGTLVENIIQAIARDLLGYWILECEAQGLPIILHCHDEVVSYSFMGNESADLQRAINIMSKGPAWAEGVPLDVEGQVLECYAK